ncbi:MAG: DUF420 domain-containing protein [Planctomycetaceae bacterium]
MTPHLPTLNASLNALSALLVLSGWLAIRRGRRLLHARLMGAAVVASLLFLVSYIVHHLQEGSTRFRGEGTLRHFYFAILISHTVLATAVVPLVAVTLVRALRGRFEKHKALARVTLPIWAYVSVTGVAIYIFLYRL